MAKRVTALRPGIIQPKWTKHICDDCKYAHWVETHQNKDWEGKYICLTCSFKQRHIIRGRQACAKFEPKGKESIIII